MLKKHASVFSLVAAALIVGIDQLLKVIVVQFLKPVITVPLWQDKIHLTYIENRGAAFSMLDGNRYLLMIFTSVIVLAGIYVIAAKKIKAPFAIWTIAVILGGGAGNLVDRIFRGYVVDYIDFRIINFAVFNFADCCVVIGTILLMIYILLNNKDSKDNELEETAPVLEEEFENDAK